MRHLSQYSIALLLILAMSASSPGIDLKVLDNYGAPGVDVTLSLVLSYSPDDLLSPKLLKSIIFELQNYVQSGPSGDTTLVQVKMPPVLDGATDDLHGKGTPYKNYTDLVPTNSKIRANTTMSGDFDSYFFSDEDFVTPTPPTWLKVLIAPLMQPAAYPTFLNQTVNTLVNIPVQVGNNARKGQKLLIKVTAQKALAAGNTFVTLGSTAGNFWIGSKGDVDIVNDVGNDVDLFDVLRIVDIAIGNVTPNSYETWAADLDNDGLIDVADVGVAMDLAVGNAPTAANYPALGGGAAALSLGQIVAGENSGYEIPVSLQASDEVRGIQMVLGVEADKVNFGALKKSSALKDMQVVQRVVDGQLSILMMNKSGKSIKAGDHLLFTIPVQGKLNNEVLEAIKMKSLSVAAANGQPMSTSWNNNGTLAGKSVPETFAVYQNSPNPFNMSTTIQYDVPQLDEMPNVSLSIFNINGQLVKRLVNQAKPAGSYTVTWDGRDEGGQFVATGIYFYRMQANDFVVTKKMAVTK